MPPLRPLYYQHCRAELQCSLSVVQRTTWLVEMVTYVAYSCVVQVVASFVVLVVVVDMISQEAVVVDMTVGLGVGADSAELRQ